jgi:7-keto-8-aminopelargonate synthetase-like enzyme
MAALDQGAHASFWDGVRMARVPQRRFRHNDAADLDTVLGEEAAARDRFVIVEGVYSMDGDAAPLDRIVPVCRLRDAILVVDDAHATGVLGAHGRGAAEHFGVEGAVDITIGTLGKAFGVMGAFAAASRDIVAFLRFFARSYMFSTALPPMVVAAVLASLDVLAREPELAERLRATVRHAAAGLARFGLVCEPVGALAAVRVPEDMDVRKALSIFEREAIFINYAVFPAVPVDQQRFRVSFSARHTKADIDRLLGAFDEVWATCRPSA